MNSEAQTATYGHSYACTPLNFKMSAVWKESRQHAVDITVRSARDPYLRAEELTKDRFDFGLDGPSQRNLGITFLVIGTLLGIIPLVRLYDAYRSNCQQPSRPKKEKSTPKK